MPRSRANTSAPTSQAVLQAVAGLVTERILADRVAFSKAATALARIAPDPRGEPDEVDRLPEGQLDVLLRTWTAEIPANLPARVVAEEVCRDLTARIRRTMKLPAARLLITKLRGTDVPTLAWLISESPDCGELRKEQAERLRDLVRLAHRFALGVQRRVRAEARRASSTKPRDAPMRNFLLAEGIAGLSNRQVAEMLVHYECATGAVEHVAERVRKMRQRMRREE